MEEDPRDLGPPGKVTLRREKSARSLPYIDRGKRRKRRLLQEGKVLHGSYRISSFLYFERTRDETYVETIE